MRVRPTWVEDPPTGAGLFQALMWVFSIIGWGLLVAAVLFDLAGRFKQHRAQQQATEEYPARVRAAEAEAARLHAEYVKRAERRRKIEERERRWK